MKFMCTFINIFVYVHLSFPGYIYRSRVFRLYNSNKKFSALRNYQAVFQYCTILKTFVLGF